MKIGLAKEVITPSFPCFLAGFAGEQKAETALDDLYVRIVVADVNNGCYGIINYDLLSVDHLIIDRLGAGMESLGLDIDHFVVTATHTHSGPCGIMETSAGVMKGMEYVLGEEDMELIDRIVAQTLQGLKAALEDRKEGTVKVARSILHDVGKNRHDPSFKGNDDIFVALLEQEEGKKAVLVNFACHPTVLNGTNLQVSADFPGAMNRYLSEKGYFFAAYLNGCCGDISTRFTRQGNGVEEVNRYGKMLSDKAESMISETEECKVSEIISETVQVELKLKTPDTVENAKAKLKEYEKKMKEAAAKGITGGKFRTIESYYEGALANLNYAENAPETSSYTISIAVYKINEDFFVCIPGELFSELANKLQNEHIHIIGYANGYLAYISDEYGYDHMFYEALSSPIEKGEPEKMMAAIREKIEQMGG